MKLNRVLLCGMMIALMPFVAAAQQASAPEASPVSQAVRFSVERASKNMVAAADEMPADKYSFHPTPAQMSFGKLVSHMIGSNYGLCSKISGIAAPSEEKSSETDPKDKLVSSLKASFDFCTQSLAKVDDSNLSEQLTVFGGRKVSRAAAMIALTNDFADHYSMAAIYLRLNGLLPPTAQPK
ncbi:MAG: DinB family protein [Candidatus Acidiferrales bacterium]